MVDGLFILSMVLIVNLKNTYFFAFIAIIVVVVCGFFSSVVIGFLNMYVNLIMMLIENCVYLIMFV